MKYEQRAHGKPYRKSLDEIVEQLPELQLNGVYKTEFKSNSDIELGYVDLVGGRELSDNILLKDESLNGGTNVSINEGNGDYKEIISLEGNLPTTYYFSLEAIKELSKFIGEPGYISETLETLTIDAIKNDVVYVKQAGFKENRVKDNLGKEIIELKSIKFILASYENGEDLTEGDNSLEIYTNNPLPGDMICIDYLDLKTKKKINNLVNGGSTHDFFEPINHEWENEHYGE